jgi:hypothetical protein
MERLAFLAHLVMLWAWSPTLLLDLGMMWHSSSLTSYPLEKRCQSVDRSGSIGSIIFQKYRSGSILKAYVIYIYIYIYIYIKKKNMQKNKLAVEYMKTCIFVLLVNEYYIIMKLEMPSILHSILMIISKL